MNAGQLAVPVRRPAVRWRRWGRVALVLAGLAALAVYLHPGLAAPGTHWPLWDVRVYWWGGQQAARGGALYAPGARYSFTYPPFAAALFALAAPAPEGGLAAVITVASTGALVVLCALSLGAAGVRRRPETVFAVTALALLTCPVAYTLHLGEVNLILAALAGTDLLRRHDGYWWQGIGTGLAAGIKLTPLIFVAYLLITRRVPGGRHRGRRLRGDGRHRLSCCCRHRPGCSGWTACSITSTGSVTRPTRRTSRCPEPWPGCAAALIRPAGGGPSRRCSPAWPGSRSPRGRTGAATGWPG